MGFKGPTFVNSNCENCGKGIEILKGTIQSCRGCFRVLTIIQDFYKRRDKLNDLEVIAKISGIVNKEGIKKGAKFNAFLNSKLERTIPDIKRRKSIINSI